MIKKYTLSILLVIVLAVSMFTATAVIASADEVDVEPTEDIIVIATEGDDYADTGAEVPTDPDLVTTGVNVSDATEPETAPETVPETEAVTEPETAVATVPATQAATADETVAPTNPGKNKPRTGEDHWLYIGIGIVAVAVIAIIISVVVSKKKKAK